ncbi:MAG: DNA-binding protein [Candidatus Moranbacteria bacterium]|nr:DNA-binding protein [Candidatus Moranbacteria bacterium]
MDTLNKNDVVSEVAQKTGQSKKDTAETIEVLLNVVTDNIKNGRKVNFTGFGSFVVRKRKGRQGHNPRTGEKMEIPAVNVPKFKAGAVLKQAVK